MARSRSSVSRSTTVRRTKFVWPITQFYLWIVLVLVTSSVLIGVFASFIQVQNQMTLGVPWLFPFGVTVGCLTILFVAILLMLSSNNTLTPGILIVFCFVLFVLYITGLVDTGIQLFGDGKVSANCKKYVEDNNIKGVGVNTLAWLEQNNICASWYVAFTFWLVGSIIFLLMVILALQVGSGQMDVTTTSG